MARPPAYRLGCLITAMRRSQQTGFLIGVAGAATGIPEIGTI
jgi:hypothetical protein